MPVQRTAQSIEVGPYEGRVGLRLTFADVPSEVFLFDAAIAAQLFHQGLSVVEALRQADAVPELHPVESTGLSDYAVVRLVQPDEGGTP